MSELNQITEQAQVMTPATTPTTSPRASMEPSADQSAETVVPETPAVKLSESEQKLQDYEWRSQTTFCYLLKYFSFSKDL